MSIDTINKIKKILKEDIEPMLAQDDGNIEFVDFKDGVLTVRLKGACAGCPFSTYTLKDNVERILKEKVPGIKSVINAD